jgi:lipopolysaccharide/colanic/teichoic acid biosynthesis glycosyltransferase
VRFLGTSAVEASSHTLPHEAGALDRALKRTADVLISATLLMLLAPVILACAIVVLAESPGPVFFRARRVGLNGRSLHVIKFRKMRHDAAGPALTGSADERFTRIGRFLATTKLDELPQLWNVLRGDMSLVGPRPEDPNFVALHQAEFDEILGVRPGITGLCQLAFAEEAAILDPNNRLNHYVERILPQKAALDRLYVRNRTIWMDLKVLVWTLLPVVLRKDVAVNRATGALTLRRRPRREDSVVEGAAQPALSDDR